MELQHYNSINAFGIIVWSLYRYYSDIARDTSLLAPIFFGVIMLVCTSGIEYDHKGMTWTALMMHIVFSGYAVSILSATSFRWTDNTALLLIGVLIFSLITLGLLIGRVRKGF